MQSIHFTRECYNDQGDYAVMTRTKVMSYQQLNRIADRLRTNAEDLVSSSAPANAENCRIAGAMLGWACSLVPIRIAVKWDY